MSTPQSLNSERVLLENFGDKLPFLNKNSSDEDIIRIGKKERSFESSSENKNSLDLMQAGKEKLTKQLSIQYDRDFDTYHVDCGCQLFTSEVTNMCDVLADEIFDSELQKAIRPSM